MLKQSTVRSFRNAKWMTNNVLQFRRKKTLIAILLDKSEYSHADLRILCKKDTHMVLLQIFTVVYLQQKYLQHEAQKLP